MANEKRSFFKRSFEIIGGTAIEIGKDYTSNAQSFITDANNIKNTVIKGATDAKAQFQNMRKSGNGPIKGLIDWFYTKESEYDIFDLDNADSDFDPGTSFGEPEEDDDKGPATLDVKGAEKVAKGHISSMFKIASKIAETQVANTAEIITTINSRTSEIVAATNNINTTLIGISKKLDVMTAYVNARSPQRKPGVNEYNSLTDAYGRFTLGTTWDAVKNNVGNSGLSTALSLFSTIKDLGGITPENILRTVFDWTIGDKELKALGNQSINQVGKNFNEAIGQSISDALSSVMDMNWFKKVFGDLKAEDRSNDFRRYTRNEYTRDPAVFDGMTRMSIVKTIPEYLKKIYESMSGKTLNVGKRGELTEKEGKTFNSVVSDSLFNRNAMDSDAMDKYLSSAYGAGSGLTRYDINTIGKALTGSYISLMMYHDIRVIDRKFVDPNDDTLISNIATFYANENGMDPGRAFAIVKSIIGFIASDRGVLNRFVGEVNYAYEAARERLEKEVGVVSDIENVGYVTKRVANNALQSYLHGRRRPPSNGSQSPPPIPPTQDMQNFFGNGDPFRIYAGAGADAARTVPDLLSDIRELLSVTTQQMVGKKRYRNISSKLSKPSVITVADPAPEYDERDYAKKRQDYSDVTIRSGFEEVKQGASQAARNFGNNIRGAFSPDGSGNILTSAYDTAIGWGRNRVEDLKDLSKDQLASIGNKLSDVKYNLAVKTGLAGLGSSKDDEEDRNTVSMISAFMQTAIQSGAASPDEKNSIQRLIDSIHNQQLKQKMSKSVNAMLDRASFKSETGEDGKGKKTIFGKLFSVLKLIVSPIKLISRAVTFLLPKIFTGLSKYVKLFNFGGDVKNIGSGIKGVWTGFGDLRRSIKDYRADKRQRNIEARQSLISSNGSTEGADGSVSFDFSVANPMMNSGFDDGSYQFANDPTKAVKRVTKIQNSAEERRARDMMRADERAEREARRELKELERARKAVEKEQRKLEKEQAKAQKNADKEGGFWNGFSQGFGGAFKGIGGIGDFKEAFRQAAGISSGKKVTVEGVDGQAESFTDRVLAKFMDLFTGKEDSVFKKIEENTEEEKGEGVGEGQDAGSSNSGAGGYNFSENNESKPASGTAGEILGSALQTHGATATNVNVGGASNAMMNLAESGSAAGTLTQGATGALSGAAGTAGQVAGSAGKALSMIGKIGASVGKIVGSLGTIGLAVAKIVIKATMMLSGFKALMRTIGSITTQLTKVVRILLEPLNKIFHAINKLLKPIIQSLSKFLKKIAGMISSVVGAIVDTVVPILNGIIMPIMKALEPVLDIITETLGPLFDLISGVIEVVMIPIGGIFKYILTPLIKQIANTIQIISGVIELGFGAVLKAVGMVVAGIGIIGKIFGASGMYDAGKKMAESGDQMMDQGKADVKNGFMNMIATAVKGWMFIDQTENYDDKHIQNPNAPEVTTIGSVMEGTVASGDFDRIYGSGNRSQRSYGSTLDISNNGCGPLALADAASRRSGSSVDGLSMASRMAASGSYEPGRGTSVGSFLSAANSMGMGLHPGGVTQASLKYASPSNPVTVVGSGADFGTRKGNNHYMNVIGTDRYGGAYVSNPLTGRVDRKSASAIAGSSLLGLYGAGDSSDYFTFPDGVTEALGELKNLTASILGIFTKSASEAMNDSMSDYDAQGQIDSLRSSVNNASGSKQYDGKSWEEIEADANSAAHADFESSNPRQPGETEEAYEARFNKWYTSSKQLKYLNDAGAYAAAESAMDSRSGSVMDAFDSISNTFKEATSQLDTVNANAKEYGNSSSGGSGGTFTADNGVELWTEKYKDNIEITDTNITSEHDNHSPLFEFFAKTMGIPLSSIGGYGWFKKYNNPDREGVGQDGGAHEGIDFSGDVDGKPLYATTGGKVVSVTPASAGDGGGNIIVWKDAGGMNHWYMHMKNEPSKKKDDIVNPGDLLGYVGNTGHSTGPHLHYTINKSDYSSGTDAINPLLYFKNYNPGSGLLGNDDFERIWSYLTTTAGLTPYAAAGLMGAWQVESGNDPNTLEGYYYFPGGKSGDTVKTALKNYETLDDFVQNKLFPAYRNDSSMNGKWDPTGYRDSSDGHYYPGLGLAQWTGGRTKNLLGFINGRNKEFNDLESQLEFFKTEKEGAYANTFAQANAANGTDQATSIILAGYEGVPGNKESQRQAYAREFFEKYKDLKFTKKTPAQEVLSTNGEYTGTVKVDEGSVLNLRKNPSTESDILATIPNGTTLKLKYDGNEGWFKTTYDGETGYVSAAYIDLDDNSPNNISGPLTFESSLATNKAKQDLVFGPKQFEPDTAQASRQQQQTQNNTNAKQEVQQTFKNANPTFGFDIWSSAQYRKLGTSSDAINKRTNAFKYLAKLADYAFDTNSQYYSTPFRNDWYIPGGKATDQLSHWGAWALDYNNWNTNPNKYADEFPKELKALKQVYGGGDSDVQFSDDFKTSMSDISGFAKTMQQLSDPSTNMSGNVTINRVTVASGDPAADERVNAILNNTYRVRAERVEYLLEQVLIKMDNIDTSGTGGSGTTETPEMFTNNDIPAAVERLSRG